MAIYHLQVTIISTAKGRCAVAASAYRRRAAMVQHATGQMFDYRGWEPIAHAELSLPADTPAWFRSAIAGLDSDASAEALWNAVEAKEGRKGTGLAMVMDIALPIELDGPQGSPLPATGLKVKSSPRDSLSTGPCA